jgi:signal peptidase II
MTRPTIFLLAALVLALDQLTKHWAVRHLPLDQIGVVLLPHVLYLTRTSNTGSAFGLFPGSTVVLAAVALIAATAIAAYVVRHPMVPAALGIALALPLGGALGNFLDRVRIGHVVDFIDARIGSYEWPVFNVADSAICIGVAILALIYAKQSVSDHPASAETEPSAPISK